ncbi:MAG: helix-turn-helix transcriptional regulator [Thermodesulfovibrionales bacterium]|nr:helix-turn-helix transcriptional regulator [Thermodesulfovibrionales bacterium]
MNEEIDFILKKLPVGLIIFDRKSIFYTNRKANNFLGRFELPTEITTIKNRIFDAIDSGRLSELFPGEICFTKKFNDSPSHWIFRIYIYDKPNPIVYIVIIEETISNKLNMNETRQQFRLTRRETDILRRVLDGFKNAEIAEDLEISEQTVKDHLSNIYMKIGVENRTGLMRTLLYSSEANTEKQE